MELLKKLVGNVRRYLGLRAVPVTAERNVTLVPGGAQLQSAEFDELLSDQAEALRDLQRCIQTHQPLRKAQWEFLSFLVHRAYQRHRLQAVQGRYFKAALQAFAAWRRLAQPVGEPLPLDDYFFSNLPRGETHELPSRVDEVVRALSAMVPTTQAEFGARNFNVAMRDGVQALNALDLHEALAEFLPMLLPVATRAVHMDTKQPLYQVEQDYSLPPIRTIESEHYSLTMLCSGVSLTAGLTLNTHRSVHPLNSFLQFQELAQLLEEVSPENTVTSSATYWLASPAPFMERYLLRYHGHQMEFSVTEFEELRDLFRRAAQQADVQLAFAKMTTLYGDI